MNPNDKYEAEFLLMYNNKSDFEQALNDISSREFKKDQEYIQMSAYTDTHDYKLACTGSSLTFRVLPNEEKLYCVLKTSHCSIVENKLLVRREIGRLVNSKSFDFSTDISIALKRTINCETEAFYPSLLIKQERYHFSSTYLDSKIHLSFDKVKYITPDHEESDFFYFSEIEISESQLETMLSKGFKHATLIKDRYIKIYNSKLIYPSKYLHGLISLNKISENLSIL
ncbi:hypothetical protein [Anoxybacillus flavithermus]|uniref:CYTH domain-containing protein n=2 Tax=Anoxybacillus flavithermus TaxID=33934 RepID=R4FDP8_9BACL|nr:hypothetical protein [Anoxybacillus flavithermus]ACJ34800.1 Predicted protein [Anoxybacillus flavithermus WK1]AST06268.1 hypothetical protein AF2641_04980 [Anoxybacillus flavithermus]GAC91616.1 hypothetical protein KN10_2052 [Anoxybacillus flavithermus NBRC 109594]